MGTWFRLEQGWGQVKHQEWSGSGLKVRLRLIKGERQTEGIIFIRFDLCWC